MVLQDVGVFYDHQNNYLWENQMNYFEILSRVEIWFTNKNSYAGSKFNQNLAVPVKRRSLSDLLGTQLPQSWNTNVISIAWSKLFFDLCIVHDSKEMTSVLKISG